MERNVFKIDKLPTVRRLPAYLHILRQLARSGEKFVSSAFLAEKLNIEPILVRKDFELTRVAGTPRVGYSISELIASIEEFLGWGEDLDAILVGVGQLGASILGYRELMDFRLRILAGFDSDPEKFGKAVHGVPVFAVTRLEELLGRLRARLAILTVPSADAQKITDLLVSAGIRGIWNYTSENIVVPADVITQKEDLASGLAVLCVKMSRNMPAPL
ncbi:MAG: redox-sensing transcriptional repressor Rex [Deltaproteobacteria bacterium]|nr:redox-sensing transcriptional repressor Rex [Deltaproteobacteria bacterium]TLN03161.1 MAG: redox-sensing transcriptional repressor Rex [bacterium]